MNNLTKPMGSIMVVDDTPENLRLLTNMLGERGYEVRPVTNGQTALQTAERSAPDLILLDINMPEMDGYETCRKLKENVNLREVPVIFLTALTDTGDKLKAFSVGGLDYISKPFQIDEVMARVNVHLGLRRAQAELARNYQRLQELEKLRDNLVQMVVHDMRSPLMVIMANLDLVSYLSRQTLPAKAATCLQGALGGVKSLTTLTDDLLDVNKMEAGKMEISRESCDLHAIAAEIAGEFSVVDNARSIHVEVSDDSIAYCDPGIVKRVFRNLISNAVKHTPSATEVRVVFQNGPTTVRVSVMDQGAGVPVEFRTHIFEKFGTLVSREKQKYHSVGLGLAFCRLAVEAHGGSIGVDSNEPRGSIFWFELGRQPRT